MSNLITENLALWTNALEMKSGTGRGSSKKLNLYGIKKLRELILELAVRGKLVSQDPNDEPASVLLERIAKERTFLVKEKRIKRPKKLSPIKQNEEFVELPSGWEFVRLNDLGEWGAGATPKRGNSEFYGGDIPWFKSGELNADYISESEETVTEEALKKTSLRYNKPGDVLIAMYGATIGKTSILKVPATTNQAVCACTPFTGFENTYLLTLLKAYRPRFIGMGAGGAQPNISREKIIATVIALPPLEEQKRIVAKVDELMALCDELESQTESSITAHELLVETLLNTLTVSADNRELSENWNRIADHFETLFTTESSIDKLKQTVLQLAVMGKLVPQDPSDEPASVLLEKIAEEKKRLVKEKVIKKPKKLPSIDSEDEPFPLPLGWKFVRLDTIAKLITKGSSPKWQGVSYTENPEDVLFVTSENVGAFELLLQKKKYVEHKFNEIEPRSILQKNDFLLNIVGGSIGRTAIYDIDTLANINQAVCLIRCFDNTLDHQFLLNFFNSSICISYMYDKQVDNARPNLSMTNIAKFVIPFPPLAEQHRIVEKVNQLMSLCDQLTARITESKTIQKHFADAVVESITGRSTEEKPDMKAPKTELVSKLKLVVKPSVKDDAPLSGILAKNKDELSAKKLWSESGLAIDDFYRQLKIEMQNGWIVEPKKAEVLIVEEKAEKK